MWSAVERRFSNQLKMLDAAFLEVMHQFRSAQSMQVGQRADYGQSENYSSCAGTAIAAFDLGD